MISRAILILPLLLIGHTAAADTTATPLSALLKTMATTNGETYLKARDAIVNLDGAALANRLADSTWSEKTWGADVAAATAHAWQHQRALCERVYKLAGLLPQNYARSRRGDPEVGRELERLKDVAPIFAEIYTGQVAYPFADESTYPRHLDPQQQRQKETAALRIGILFALGRSQHPLGPQLFSRVMADKTTPEPERRAAAIALGETAHIARVSPIPMLTELARDQDAAAWLRGGAVIGVAKAGRRGHQESLQALAALLEQPELQRPAISGLAILGASAGAATAPQRAEISDALVTLLAGDVGDKHGPAIAEAIAVVGHPSATAALTALLDFPETSARLRGRVNYAQRILEITLSRQK